MNEKRSRAEQRRQRRTHVRPGTAPGMIATDPSAPPPRIRVLACAPDDFIEIELEDVKEITPLRQQWPLVWINIDGVRHGPTLQSVQELFALHPLALEDVAHLDQRAKVDLYEEHLFIVVRMVTPESDAFTEQIALFFGDGYVLSFQERDGDCFEPVRERIRAGRGRLRSAGSDYLTYALIDAVVDGYFPWLDRITAQLEQLESRVFSEANRRVIAELQKIRGELREIRRANLPHRDVVAALIRDDTPRISDSTRIYLNDCADHAVRVSDMVDAARDESSDLMHAYLSTASNRMNEVMKVLTIVAAVFIPLSFIAGLYGMNFDTTSPWNMPELSWSWGYPAVLAVMLAVAGGMLIFFKRKRWLG